MLNVSTLDKPVGHYFSLGFSSQSLTVQEARMARLMRFHDDLIQMKLLVAKVLFYLLQ